MPPPDEVRNLGDAAEWFACLTPSGKPPARMTVRAWRTTGFKVGSKRVKLKTVEFGTVGVGVRKSDAVAFLGEIGQAVAQAVK